MIPNEIKYKIYALYWGCEFIEYDKEGKTFGPYKIDDEGMDRICNVQVDSRIILKPLSEITDEDAMEVARLRGVYGECIKRDNERVIVEDNHFKAFNIYFTGYCCKRKNGALYNDFVLPAYDFLRLRGYMLPAYGFADLFSADIAIKTENKQS